MYTTSIIYVQQLLAQLVSSFENVEAYKVELSIWDFSKEPVMQLYVSCFFNNEYVSIHTKSQSVVGALKEIEEWYRSVSNSQLAIAS